jgi:Spy/CpxP family protein refolding chaperone
MREAFVRLDTTPGQEKAIVAIIEHARDKVRDLRGELVQLRKEIAALLGSQVLDRTQLDARIEMMRHVVSRLGDELGEALSQVHEVLDDRQRRTLSELIADGSFSRSPFVGC